MRNFLLVVVDKDATELASIYGEFAALVAAEEGRLEVELTTAYELFDDDAREIVAQIEKASARQVDATCARSTRT